MDKTSLVFTSDELNGCPGSFLEERKLPDGKIKVSFPDYADVVPNCTVAETRRRMEQSCSVSARAFSQNKPILQEIVMLRHKMAEVLGFKDYPDYATQTSMAKTGKAVQGFITEFKEKATPMLKADLAKLEALKAEHEGGEHEIFAWDREFYCKLVEKTECSVDHEAIKEYFPVDAVIEGALHIFENLLGLKFEHETSMEGDAAWHDDVKAYRVTDTASKKLLGFIYADLHQREDKFDHECCFDAQDGCKIKGQWQVPVALILTSFAKATDTKPALLSHANVTGFLHELGHAMHHLCSEAELNDFSGMNVEMDYLEMPSQMFENWAYQPEALRLMSRHYKTGEPLPDGMMESLLLSSKANPAIKNFGAMWWVARSAIDQAIHTAPSKDVGLFAQQIWADFMGVKASPGTQPGPVRHMANADYGAMWYSYLWSQVYSADAFSRFEKEGIFNPATGAKYRKEILAPGGSRDGMDSLMAFLDRQPSVDAFLKAKGLSADTSHQVPVPVETQLNQGCQVETRASKRPMLLREVN